MELRSLFAPRPTPSQPARPREIVSFAKELSQQVASLDQKDRVDLNPHPGYLGHIANPWPRKASSGGDGFGIG